jgi:two-component sensor histidine kinase
VALDEYLSGLLAHLQGSMRDQWRGVFLKFQLAPLTLKTDHSVSLGIVLAEWVTNACKYAYPNGSGEVRVILRRLAGDQAELSVEDDGKGGGKIASHEGTGLGTRIVQAMAKGLSGSVEYANLDPGTAARITFPIEL